MRKTSSRRGTGVTQQDVAALAGVSVMTVSNVINGTIAVSVTKRQAVLDAIEALGYRPNIAARELAKARSERIGLLYSSVNNAFIGATLVGALKTANAVGAQILIGAIDGPGAVGVCNAINELIQSGAKAILLSPPYAELLIRTGSLADIDVPIAAVAVGCALPPILAVRIDDRKAAEAMTDLLIRKGHRRIAFIKGPESHSSAAMRLEGYLSGMACHGLSVDPLLIASGDYTFESGITAAEYLLSLDPMPSAIFASNDEMAAAVISFANRRQLVVPGDISVAGFDDSPLATAIWPPLTTISQPIAQMADFAVRALLQAIRNEHTPADQVVEFELIERASVADRCA